MDAGRSSSDVARELRALVARCTPLLDAIAPADAASRPASGKWSKQQIVGHLIDSATNNQQRFVRLLTASAPLAFVGYAQDAWVEAQRYQDASWPALVRLWAALNDHLAHVIGHADTDRPGATITVDGRGPFALALVVRDYVDHCKHHLRAVLPDAGIDGA